MSYVNPTSLTFWAGLIALLRGILGVVAQATGSDVPGGSANPIEDLSLGAGLIGLRRAVQ